MLKPKKDKNGNSYWNLASKSILEVKQGKVFSIVCYERPTGLIFKAFYKKEKQNGHTWFKTNWTWCVSFKRGRVNLYNLGRGIWNASTSPTDFRQKLLADGMPILSKTSSKKFEGLVCQIILDKARSCGIWFPAIKCPLDDVLFALCYPVFKDYLPFSYKSYKGDDFSFFRETSLNGVLKKAFGETYKPLVRDLQKVKTIQTILTFVSYAHIFKGILSPEELHEQFLLQSDWNSKPYPKNLRTVTKIYGKQSLSFIPDFRFYPVAKSIT